MFSEATDSYFDRYLNEVIYLFEKSNADAIVFEDIDRFEKTSIFERLREINTLLNNHLGVNNEEPIRFFYLLRDDLFASKDRTKFFDYIMPVIPFVDGNNSYEKLKNILNEFNLDSKFLKGGAIYVDDYRILKNIYNEYVIYYRKLTLKNKCNESSSIEPNKDKLLAFIIYKNLFPIDFSSLQNNKGYVFDIINEKEALIEKNKKQIRIEIEKIKNDMEKVKKEHLISLDELEIIKKYLNDNLHVRNGYNSINPSIKEKQDIFLKKYNERKETIEKSEEHIQKEMMVNIEKLQYSLTLIKNKKIFELLSNDNDEMIFNREDFKCKYKTIIESHYFDLLKYLIRSGYIDESYSDYITIFYEGVLSINDKVFVRGVFERNKENPRLVIDNPKNILDSLTYEMFSQKEILHISLIKYVLENHSLYYIYINFLIKQLKESKNFNFIKEFWYSNVKNDKNEVINDKGKEINITFVKSFISLWPSVLIDLFKDKTFHGDVFSYYNFSKIYISNCDGEQLRLANENGELSEYISSFDDYLDKSSYEINGFIDELALINVKFKRIDNEFAEQENFEKVYENSLYEINFENLHLMVVNFYTDKSRGITYDDFIKKSYSVIKSNKETPIFNYIYENIEEYLNFVINSDNKEIHDDESSVIEIANLDIDIEIKKQYLKMLKINLKNIVAIEDDQLWTDFFTNLTVECNLTNLVEYHTKVLKGGVLDNALIYYFNEMTMDKFNIDDNYRIDYVKKFLEKFIENENVDNIPYKNLISKSGWHYEKDFNKKGLSIDKMKILIDTNCIRMSLENLNFLRSDEHYKNSVINDFIIHNIEEYIELFDDSSSFRNELVELLKGEEIGEAKIKLLEKSKGTYSIAGNYLTNTEKQYILENNFDINDIGYMVSHYDDLAEIKDDILSILVNNENELQKHIDSTSYNLMKDIAEDNFSVQTK
nr:hypothetical protein [Providencia stuartii]